MPFRAQVDEREIQVWDLTGEQWSELKRASRTAPGRIQMACCGGPGAAKTSRGGNPFRHDGSLGRARFGRCIPTFQSGTRKREDLKELRFSRILRLALLAPDIVEAILGGWADQRVMLERPLPRAWEQQQHTAAR